MSNQTLIAYVVGISMGALIFFAPTTALVVALIMFLGALVVAFLMMSRRTK